MLSLILYALVAGSQETSTAQYHQVDALWLRLQAGDAGAGDSLISMGPAARTLTHRLLYPGQEDRPWFPTGRNREILNAILADAMPELAKVFSKLDETDREECLVFLDGVGGSEWPCDLGRCESRNGRFVRPLGDVLTGIYDSENEMNQNLILRILAKANVGEELRVSELQRGLKEYYFGHSSIDKSRTDFGNLQAFIEIFALRPEPSVVKQIRDIANFHPDGYVRHRAFLAYMSANNHPELAISHLRDFGVR